MKVRKIRPQRGPQEQFCACPAEIAIYGGSAFGGKSWALAYEAARFATVDEYAAVIFRRTTPELTGGGSIWEETKKLYPHLGGRRRESPNLDWFFPSGAWVGFRHLQHEDTVYEHQGKQYATVGFDELTHFTAAQFWYMLSRVRSSAKVPKRVRGTCNPDPDSFVRELIDWWIGKDGKAIEERSGVIRYMARVDEAIVWGDTPEAVKRQAPELIRLAHEPKRSDDDPRMEPLSFTFIRAKAADNRIGLERDPTYLSRLAMLTGAERKRLLDGDWNARDSAGDYFNRVTCPILDAAPPRNTIKRIVRFWDKAATSPSTENPDPDYTRGAKVAEMITADGELPKYVLLDLESCRKGPGEVEALQKHTAESDGREVEVGAYCDPGQAGKVDEHHMRLLFSGFAFTTIPTIKSVEVYAKAWVTVAAQGRFAVVRAPYLTELWREVEGYPSAKHDDIVSSISGAMQVLTGGGFAIAYHGAPAAHHPLDGVRDDDDDDDGFGGGGGRGEAFGRGRGVYV